MTGWGTAVHEAGHAAVARACGGTVQAVTVVPAGFTSGCTRWRRPASRGAAPGGLDVSQPFVLWPEAFRRWAETEVMVALAGRVAEEMAGLPVGRGDQADLERAAEVGRRVHGGDPFADAVAGAWAAYLRHETQALLELHWRRVQRLAGALEEAGSLGGEAIKAILAA
jgi:hypothetical protein